MIIIINRFSFETALQLNDGLTVNILCKLLNHVDVELKLICNIFFDNEIINVQRIFDQNYILKLFFIFDKGKRKLKSIKHVKNDF